VYARRQVTPSQWPDLGAQTGASADEIPGVCSIGAQIAAALLAGGLGLDGLPHRGGWPPDAAGS
jgi:5'-3' exonuclease